MPVRPSVHRFLRLFLFATLLWLPLAMGAQGYKDVTKTYIKNADQRAAAGWNYKRQTVDGEEKAWSTTNKLYRGSYDSEIFAGDPLAYTTFSATQVVTLPRGSYHLVGRAFQRDVPNVVLFAEIGGQRTTVGVQSVYGQYTNADGADKSPASMEAAAQAFNGNMYLNDLAFEVVDDDAQVTIGYDGEFTAARQWFIFGAMTLYQVQDEVSTTCPVDITPRLNRAREAYTGLTGRYANANVYIHEKYATAAFGIGEIVSQTFTGLDNGIYEVVLNASASKANGIGTLPSAPPYVFAGDIRANVNALERSEVTTVGAYTLRKVAVTDGTLHVGIGNQAEGGNWVLFNVKSVKFCGVDLSTLVARYQSLLATAHTLQGQPMQASVSEALDIALAKAETDVDTESQQWLEETLSQLSPAVAAAQESATLYAGAMRTAVENMKAQAVHQWVSDSVQALYDSGAYGEVKDVYARYQAMVIASLPTQPETDFTSVLINPGFETGTTIGWTIVTNGEDTGVRDTGNATYAYDGAEGKWLFNTWSKSICTLDIGQTVHGLPVGYYRLSANVAGFGDGAPITLTANSRNASVSPTNPDVQGEVVNGHLLSLDNILVTDGTLSFAVLNTGKGNTFFKVDNFQLTLLRTYEGLEQYTDLRIVQNLENEEVARYIAATHYDEASPTAVRNFNTTPALHNDRPATVSVPLPAQQNPATLLVASDNLYTDALALSIAPGTLMGEVANLVPGRTYYYKMEADGTTVASGTIETQGQLRMIKTEGGSNIRDLGGWPTADGGRVRYGLLYRGAELRGGNTYTATDADLEELARLGIRAEVDLREDVDLKAGFPKASPIPGAAYTYENLNRWSEDALNLDIAKWRDAFNLIYRTLSQGDAAYFHCIFGADRTGCMAFLIEGLLGVGVDAMYKDYELTSFSSAGIRTKDGIDHKLQYIKSLPGTTLQEQFFNYWRGAVGVEADTLRQFIRIMVDGPNVICSAELAPLSQKAVEDGEYYLYLPKQECFLGRGESLGVRAVADRYGVPVTVWTNGAGVSTIQYLDSRLYLGSDGFTDKPAYYNSVSWHLEQYGDGLVLRSLGGRYMHVNDDHCASVEATMPDNATLFAFVPADEQQDLVRTAQLNNILSAAQAAGLNGVTDVATLNSLLESDFVERPCTGVVKSATTGSTTNWVLSEPYARDETANYGNAYNVGNYGGELYQKNAVVSQTVTVPRAGLYRLRLNALYRQGNNATCYALGQQGYDLGNAYVCLNDTYYARIPSWYSHCSAPEVPNTTDQAKVLVDGGAYEMEVYAYVGDDCKLTISVCVPGFVSMQWCLFNNFQLTSFVPKDGSGIADRTEDVETMGKEQYFAPSGVAVQRPSRGIYIVRRAGRWHKVNVSK